MRSPRPKTLVQSGQLTGDSENSAKLMLDLLSLGAVVSEGELFEVGLLFQGISHPVRELFNANPGTDKVPGPPEYFAPGRVLFNADVAVHRAA